MDTKTLFDKYHKIEKELYPIKDFLEENRHSDKYKALYKGFITIQSPLIFKPDILFLGINPGEGAFIENRNNKIEASPIRVFDSEINIELDWYKDGNARGYSKNKKWHSHKWYETKERINNRFVVNMIDVLYKVALLKFPDNISENNEEPFWHKGFGQNIMFTNLYPVATKDTNGLNSIFRYFAKEPKIFSHFGFTKPVKKWDIQRNFIRKIEETVKLVEPKVIVCIGTQAFNDFTFTTTKKNKKVFKGNKGDFPVIGFSRSGNWSNLTSDIANYIVEEMKKNTSDNSTYV